jgi:hypothetical protein
MSRSLALIAGLLAFATPAFALDLPTRKAGQWEVKMVFESRAAHGHEAVRRCRH